MMSGLASATGWETNKSETITHTFIANMIHASPSKRERPNSQHS